MISDSDKIRYSRQLILPGWSTSKQEKLNETALVINCKCEPLIWYAVALGIKKLYFTEEFKSSENLRDIIRKFSPGTETLFIDKEELKLDTSISSETCIIISDSKSPESPELLSDITNSSEKSLLRYHICFEESSTDTKSVLKIFRPPSELSLIELPRLNHVSQSWITGTAIILDISRRIHIG
jgi:hypothetical protein